MAEQLFELRRRTFDTPHFRGITFIETEAKTILNKVPGNYLPFNWTINPYRGCSHACSYCVWGGTPILMADGRSKPLEDVVVGDQIYGTTFDGKSRRYVRTEVLAHWSTLKKAYRITLGDGTELIASGDHRFLSDRGWKHVADAELGAHRRPFLRPTDRLVGIDDIMDAGDARLNSAPSEGGSLKCAVDLRVRSIEDLGIEIPMFDITTGTGDFIANGVVSHNCFARATHTFLDMDAGRDFETKIVVKVNAPDLLRRELRKKRWSGESIAMGTNTDPYQRCEGKYKLMPRIIEVLTEYRNPFSILTKGTLIMRDIEALARAAELTDVSTGFSIATLDEDAWRRSEPGTPHPRKRLEAVKRLNEAGVACGVLVAPILPGITDRPEQLREVVEAAIEAGATHVSPILLHLRPKVKEVYMEWLRDEYPDLVPRYQEMYARSAYASTHDKDELSKSVRDLIASYGGIRATRRRKTRESWRSELERQKAKLSTEQMKLL